MRDFYIYHAKQSLSFCCGRKGKEMVVMARTPEGRFQDKLRDELKERFPDCFIAKLDCQQGIPDLLVLHNKQWALLECKRAKNASHQPNQDYYVDKFDNMSFARFIYPENKDEVLAELEEFYI